MALTFKKCSHDPKILCGVVKNVGNCPFYSSLHCQADNVENWMGFNNQGFGSITLKRFRYKPNNKEASANMCCECRVIWTDPTITCPICKEE